MSYGKKGKKSKKGKKMSYDKARSQHFGLAKKEDQGKA